MKTDSNPHNKGFTLLELLIVIAIIAILSAILIFVLNPAETLKKGRDSQRISDLKTLHRAIALYITTVSDLSNFQDFCNGPLNNRVCAVSFSGDGASDPPNEMTDQGVYQRGIDCPTGGSFEWYFDRQDITNIDRSGWIGGVDFTRINGGSPISHLPLDPNFQVRTLDSVEMGRESMNCPRPPGDPVFSVGASDLLYVFVCKPSTLEYELMANMESEVFSYSGSEDKEGTDGGNYKCGYEVGTNLNLLVDP